MCDPEADRRGWVVGKREEGEKETIDIGGREILTSQGCYILYDVNSIINYILFKNM